MIPALFFDQTISRSVLVHNVLKNTQLRAEKKASTAQRVVPIVTGDHIKKDQILLVKIGKYVPGRFL